MQSRAAHSRPLDALLWTLAKLVFWIATPSPTGLENMPAFRSSLACSFKGEDQKMWQSGKTSSLPEGDLSINIMSMDTANNAGILTFVSGSSPSRVQIKTTIISAAGVSAEGSASAEFSDGAFTLQLNDEMEGCQFWDIMVYLPKKSETVRTISINSKVPSQIKVSSIISADRLDVKLSSLSQLGLVLPYSPKVKDSHISMAAGYISGAIDVWNSSSISTNPHAVAAITFAVPEHTTNAIRVKTEGGSERSNFDFYTINRSRGAIIANHTSSGDLFLNYKRARLDGKFETSADGGHFYSGLGSSGIVRSGTGDDRVVANTKGWMNVKV